ncbi:MAG: ABC transporter permease, partial [Huintestinicola sp.]
MYGYEQSNFRQAGGYSHGGFKYLTEEQFNELKGDKLIKEYSLRRFVGMPENEPFAKTHVEVSYCDENAAKWNYCTPIKGRLPEENTNETATDTRVLSLLGIEPKIGAEFTVTFDVDGKETTETFTLCGWWEHDEAIVASHILIPESRAEEIFTKLDTKGNDGMTGTYNLDVMLKSKAHIEDDLLDILERHGYQNEQHNDTYISIGVNWGYVSAQLSNNIDAETIFAIAAPLVLIIITGYLIIYNVFNISVSNDIRRYGLLKTIGTTGRQIKRMVYIEAITLSAVGIPIGLILGFLCGSVLTPIVMAQLNGIENTVSASPVIFIGAAVFSLVTVFISCMKPAKNAARVSPVEAVRYTEGSGRKKTLRKTKGGASLSEMAFANLGRSISKTAVTIASMSLSVVLLCVTFIFSNGFDMNKYLGARSAADYIVSDASYFQTGRINAVLPEDAVQYITSQTDIEDGGRTYRTTSAVYEYVTEEWYRQRLLRWSDEDTVNRMVEITEKQDGLLQDDVQLYGMEQFCLDKLKVFEGDISKLGERNYIAAVYHCDDYGNIEQDSNWAKIGDKVQLRYVDEFEYYNT